MLIIIISVEAQRFSKSSTTIKPNRNAKKLKLAGKRNERSNWFVCFNSYQKGSLHPISQTMQNMKTTMTIITMKNLCLLVQPGDLLQQKFRSQSDSQVKTKNL